MNVPYYDAVEKFFMLKNLYETKRSNLVKKILFKKDVSKKNKIKAIRNIKVPCISCKKYVNSIFDITNDKYIAICGDSSSKCKLNIEIEKQKTIWSFERKKELQQLIDEDTYHIIKIKLALLFGFINEEELESIYETIRDEYKTNQKELSEINNFISESIDLKNRYEEINTIQQNTLEFIKTIKNTVSEFLLNNNPSYISDVVHIYDDDLYPNMKTLREIKNRVMHVEYVNNKIILLQNENTIENYEKVIKNGNVISYSY